MTGPVLTELLAGGGFFECPRWREGRWWVSDFYREAVYTVTTDGREEHLVDVEHQPAGLGWLPDGSLLIVSMKDQRVLRRDSSGGMTVHADLSSFTDSSLNDMVIDTHGRAERSLTRSQPPRDSDASRARSVAMTGAPCWCVRPRISSSTIGARHAKRCS
jgi:sugar lactone lactonase YvrE